MKKNNIRFIAESAVIAALYVALTWLLAPISYGEIQFRVSEILILLVVLNRKYAFALVLGCFVANTTSSLGWYDMVFGTLATTIAILPMLKIKRFEIAALFPVISNAFIVSLELSLAFELGFGTVFWLNAFTVGLGEAVVLYFLGIPAMMALTKNQSLVEVMELDIEGSRMPEFFTLTKCLGMVAGVIAVIFYVAYPLQFVNGEYFSALALTKTNLWMMMFAFVGIVIILCSLFLKGKIQLFVNALCFMCLLACYILVGVLIPDTINQVYYYGYIVYLALFVLFGYFSYQKSKQIVE